MPFNHKEIEPKWQKYWDEHKTFKTDCYDDSKPKYYCVDMFPYPSGNGLHVGQMCIRDRSWIVCNPNSTHKSHRLLTLSKYFNISSSKQSGRVAILIATTSFLFINGSIQSRSFSTGPYVLLLA